MENCIFCQIIDGHIPSSKIYEDDDVLAFLDISQTTSGHSLLVPKKHTRNLLEISDDASSTLFRHLPKIARGLQTATQANGMNIIANSEEAAGQTVFHTHIHLIPRYDEKDEFSLNYTTHEPDFEALGQLAEKISKEVH